MFHVWRPSHPGLGLTMTTTREQAADELASAVEFILEITREIKAKGKHPALTSRLLERVSEFQDAANIYTGGGCGDIVHAAQHYLEGALDEIVTGGPR